jgi:high-affinity Fe2+/Pb2+ permease
LVKEHPVSSKNNRKMFRRQNFFFGTMKLFQMLLNSSLAALSAVVLFPAIVGAAATTPTVVWALLGVGVVLTIVGDVEDVDD